ncbi:TPA: hypothetical protein ACKP89_000534 [Stenotrophomonas maltophilia]|uniref:Uncharacterized protein n=1 Tax=Stenotrophomonas maltophilia (strain K279a) TaxID=522373 RepID=B2FMU2_STRMK|nr:hypothetical protein [Stenotrophomonas maltophilia]MBH1697514.1 hypothetical protein [Stenotrophomonas maltophilia]MBH1710530.1 hypothetical protein [Stenotrophomonas maltophilia]MBN5045187.1 hypothetical protein [Stenotrophomonas maltophilia]QNG80710.1 hypothetical protein FLFIOBJN_00694 [Stenotrophomonas maltophilia]CAQ45463.1 conserved hypothetical protein [Stenotrophomonas maltophilia K279a]
MSNQQAGTSPLADPQTPIESAVKDLARTQQELHIAVEQLALRLAPVLAASKPDAAPSTGRALGASSLLEDLFQRRDAAAATLGIITELHSQLTL